MLRPLLPALAAVLLAACQSADLSGPGLGLEPVGLTAYGEVENRAPAALVLDAGTGETLFANKADELRHPASLTKLMTLYLLFEAINSGGVSLDDTFVVSANAASKPPSKIGLKPGERISVRDAIQGITVKSGNDVGTVVAEGLGGSEARFAALMTAKAHALGMTRTQFVNPTGLPDDGQITTAHDMAILARALRTRFPQYMPFFDLTEFQYGGRTFKATNHLLGKVDGVDGMKTGYIRDSGFNIVVSAHQGIRSIIVVVIGGATGRARDARATELVEKYL